MTSAKKEDEDLLEDEAGFPSGYFTFKACNRTTGNGHTKTSTKNVFIDIDNE